MNKFSKFPQIDSGTPYLTGIKTITLIMTEEWAIHKDLVDIQRTH